jgi:hypothetical protein
MYQRWVPHCPWNLQIQTSMPYPHLLEPTPGGCSQGLEEPRTAWCVSNIQTPVITALPLLLPLPARPVHPEQDS